jgi:hypothetical protein
MLAGTGTVMTPDTETGYPATCQITGRPMRPEHLRFGNPSHLHEREHSDILSTFTQQA